MRETHGEPLAEHTTMRLGGPARRFVVAESAEELVDAVRASDDADEPVLVLGGGSNVVVADAGFDGTVVKVATRGVAVRSDDRGVHILVQAGEPWDEVVTLAVDEGWLGIEALSGIPGSTGATPLQNVGAYGQEVAQTISWVRVWDRGAAVTRTLTNSDCRFAYRHSLLKATPGRFVVLEVLFRLELGELSRPVAYADLARQLGVGLGERAPLTDVRQAVLTQRRQRGMVLDASDRDTWSCGSFFTNPIVSDAQFTVLEARAAARLGPDAPGPPRFTEAGGAVKTSAAWLIDKAGFGKGFGMPGPAAVSTKHALAVTNRGGASAAQVAALARTLREGVREAFGVTLVNEPVFVGHEL